MFVSVYVYVCLCVPEFVCLYVGLSVCLYYYVYMYVVLIVTNVSKLLCARRPTSSLQAVWNPCKINKTLDKFKEIINNLVFYSSIQFCLRNTIWCVHNSFVTTDDVSHNFYMTTDDASHIFFVDDVPHDILVATKDVSYNICIMTDDA